MTSAYPAITGCVVTAAAMRAAAGIIEESALPGLSVTCTSQEITVQVPEASGDPAERAAQVGRLARIAGSHAYRDDSRVTAYAQVKAYGQARGIPVSIFTPLQVRPRPGGSARAGGELMAAKTAASRDITAELAYLTRALKAPTLRDAVPRLAERARAETWTHEEFLAACLQREVSARESHGGEERIRAARFPARKALEDFDYEHQRSLRREVIAHLGTLDFVGARDN